jgi:hypothetical protein
MSRIEVIEEGLPGFMDIAVLVKDTIENEFYVVSSTNVPLSGPETLVFPSDENGEISSWADVVGGRQLTTEEAIEMLEDHLEGE